MDKAHIQKKYANLLRDVENNDFYKTDLTNRVNCYQCSCGHITKTRDIDSGVTPFMFTCEECGDTATSTMYRDIAPHQQPTIEWYRPTMEQVLKMKNKPDLLGHILSGGLDYRKVPPPDLKPGNKTLK